MRPQFKSLFMRRGILFRKVQDQYGDIDKLMIQMGYNDKVLKGRSDQVGHFGVERTTRLLREPFY